MTTATPGWSEPRTAARFESHRQPSGGRLDRSRELRFTVDGLTYTGHPGDTVASALLAHGRIEVGPSPYRRRPRGIVAAGVEEPNAVLRVGGDRSESMLPATSVPVEAGLTVHMVSGPNRLPGTPEATVNDQVSMDTDVLVVGAGPAGLAAALAAARSGARTMLVDDQPEPGGSLLSGRTEQVDGWPALDWVAGVARELDAAANVTVLPGTTAFGSGDDHQVAAVERRIGHPESPVPGGGSRRRLWHIRARQVVLATGAQERPLVFAGNDRPGVMLASAVRSYLNRYAVRAGDRVVVATTNDSAYDLVADLQAAGVEVTAVVDARPGIPERAGVAGVWAITGSVVNRTRSTDPSGRVTSVTVRGLAEDGSLGGEPVEIECDTVAVAGGWSPVLDLHRQRRGRVRWDDDRAAFLADGAVRDQQVVGSAAGAFDLATCLVQGTAAGATAATAAGFPAGGEAPRGVGGGVGRIRPVWLVPGEGEPGEWHEHFVDLQRDQTVADVWRAIGAGPFLPRDPLTRLARGAPQVGSAGRSSRWSRPSATTEEARLV